MRPESRQITDSIMENWSGRRDSNLDPNLGKGSNVSYRDLR
jgi:hypothetical protein